MTAPVSKLQTLIAIKAIALAPKLTSNERRVAVVIIEHFRRIDGRCDPSVDRIADLLGLSIRTVLRSVDGLDRRGLILKNRHGGRFAANHYEPQWARFAELEAKWNEHFRASGNAKKKSADLSSPTCRSRHRTDDSPVTQTCLLNLQKEPEGVCIAVHYDGRRRDAGVAKRQASQEKEELAPASPVPPVRRGRGMASLEAALAAAERRWGGALLNALPPAGYVAAVEAIDDGLRAEATAAELKRHGAGLALILERLGLPRPDEAAADLRGSSQAAHPLAVVSDPEATPVKLPETRVIGGYGGYGGYGSDGGYGGTVSTARSEPVNEDREPSRTSHARPLTTEHLVAREEDIAPEAPPAVGGGHA